LCVHHATDGKDSSIPRLLLLLLRHPRRPFFPSLGFSFITQLRRQSAALLQ
jgi:hypothetical protein